MASLSSQVEKYTPIDLVALLTFPVDFLSAVSLEANLEYFFGSQYLILEQSLSMNTV